MHRLANPTPTVPTGIHGRRDSSVAVHGLDVNLVLYDSPLELTAHVHERANLCFVLSGSFTEDLGGKATTCRRGQVIVKAPGVVHRDRFHERSETINIEIEPNRLQSLQDDGPVLRTSRVLETTRAAAIGFELRRELCGADDVTPVAVEGLVLGLIAEDARRKRPSRCNAPSWIRRVEEMLRDRFPELPRLTELAREVGVHPCYLSERFRSVHGCSIGEWVRRRRVSFAAKQIQCGTPLSEVAITAGFCDQSHFSRVFKRLTGLTPGEFGDRA